MFDSTLRHLLAVDGVSCCEWQNQLVCDSATPSPSSSGDNSSDDDGNSSGDGNSGDDGDDSEGLLPRRPEPVTQLVQRSNRGEEVTAVSFSYL